MDACVQCLNEAQRIIGSLGNPSSRIFSKIVEVRDLIDTTSLWKADVHSLLYHHKLVTEGALEKLLETFPSDGLVCEEKRMVEALLEAVKKLHGEVVAAFAQRSGMSCRIDGKVSLSALQSVMEKVRRAEVEIDDAERLQRKLETGIRIQEQIDHLLEGTSDVSVESVVAEVRVEEVFDVDGSVFHCLLS